MHTDPLWSLTEDHFDPQRQHTAETNFTIGNGYLGTRGAFEEGFSGEMRATFVHGVFDDAPVFFTELANAPDWLDTAVIIAGERFTLSRGEILDYRRTLSLRDGLLTREVRWRSPAAHTVDLHFERFASLADPHLLFLRIRVTPLDFNGTIEFRSGLDAAVDNLGLVHWNVADQHAREDVAWLYCRTRATQIGLAMGARLALQGGSQPRQAAWDAWKHPTLVASRQVSAGQAVTAEKSVCIYTTRDTPDPLSTVLEGLKALPAWPAALDAQRRAWEREWDACDVIVEGDDEAQLALRFNLFHLLIAASRSDERVSIGARTLSGYGYRGHVFWDTEIFIVPFFTFTRPEISANLLSYRWHTLDGARRKAHEEGFRGAQYAWESAATGDEVTPTWVPHPTDRRQSIRIWTGDIEIHITSDVAYAVWQYWRTSGDDAFMRERGAEILLETARFWGSRPTWNHDLGRYEINHVVGPDEYHDRVDNSAFTNYMARWHLRTALDLLTNHPELSAAWAERLSVSTAERLHWQAVAEKLYCPFDAASGRIEQFDGYFGLTDPDPAGFEPRTQSWQAILGIEGVAATQLIKQPDVLMLLYLLPDLYGTEVVRANYAYYTPRTDHAYGSSLGPSIQAIMACEVGDVAAAYEHFMRSARADLRDVRGNARDGIHAASAGGLWQAAVFGFGGLKVTPQGWSVSPRLPAHWKRLAFKFVHRGQRISVDLPEAATGKRGAR